jgi:hypothetical protein
MDVTKECQVMLQESVRYQFHWQVFAFMHYEGIWESEGVATHIINWVRV